MEEQSNRKDSKNWLKDLSPSLYLAIPALVFWLTHYEASPTNDPVKLTPLQEELKYEQEFLKDEKPPYVWAKVRLDNGAHVTGRVVFIPECPSGRLCAEPDASVRDENGNDVTVPSAPDSDN